MKKIIRANTQKMGIKRTNDKLRKIIRNKI